MKSSRASGRPSESEVLIPAASFGNYSEFKRSSLRAILRLSFCSRNITMFVAILASRSYYARLNKLLIPEYIDGLAWHLFPEDRFCSRNITGWLKSLQKYLTCNAFCCISSLPLSTPPRNINCSDWKVLIPSSKQRNNAGCWLYLRLHLFVGLNCQRCTARHHSSQSVAGLVVQTFHALRQHSVLWPKYDKWLVLWLCVFLLVLRLDGSSNICIVF